MDEIAADDRKVVVTQFRSPGLDRSVAAGTPSTERVDYREVRPGRSTAVIADAVQTKPGRIGSRLACVLLKSCNSNPGSIATFPHKQRRQSRFGERRPCDHVGRQTCVGEDSRQPIGMPKRVRRETDRASPTRHFFEHLLAQHALSTHRLGRRAEQIGFHPPTTDRFPTAGFDEAANAAYQRRVVVSEPLVYDGLAHHERRRRMLVQQLDSGPRVSSASIRASRGPHTQARSRCA